MIMFPIKAEGAECCWAPDKTSYWNPLYLLLIRFWTQIDLDCWELGYLKALRSSITLLIISTSAFPTAIQRERKIVITAFVRLDYRETLLQCALEMLLRCELNCNFQFYGTTPTWIAFGNNWNKNGKRPGQPWQRTTTQTTLGLPGWALPLQLCTCTFLLKMSLMGAAMHFDLNKTIIKIAIM